MDVLTITILLNIFIVCYGQPPPIMPNPGPGMQPVPRMPTGGRAPQRVMPNTGGNQPPPVSNPNPRPNTRVNPRQGMPSIPGTNTGGQCTSSGRDTIARCIQTNGGLTMQDLISVLSEGSQGGPLPRNSAQISSAVCRSQGTIIGCIFSGVSGLRSSTQCTTNNQEYVRLEQETVGIVSGIQQMCGKGPLPAPDACHRNLHTNLRQCYSKVGLDPELFTPNSTTVFRASGPSEFIGAIIGEDAKTAGKFCRVKGKLFECMKQVIEKCSGAMEILALSGYEQEALQKGIDVLCHDVGVYVDGLRCFQNPSQQVQGCYNTLVSRLTELSAEQLRQSMPMNTFYNKYCQ
ncbi:hypothetical protein ACF0H5_019436 [Mactra antiquata]